MPASKAEQILEAIKALLDAGHLGQPRLIEAAIHWYRSDAYYAEKPWRSEAEHGGGSLFNQGVHNLDLMLWLFGAVDSVQGKTTTLGHAHAVEDTTAALLSFASGALGVIVTSTALPPGRPAMLRLFTDRGSCELANDSIVRWDFPGIAEPPSAAANGATHTLLTLDYDPYGNVAERQGADGQCERIAYWPPYQDLPQARTRFVSGCGAMPDALV